MWQKDFIVGLKKALKKGSLASKLVKMINFALIKGRVNFYCTTSKNVKMKNEK